MEQNKTFIGLDVGTRFIGVAVGQTLTQTATPLRVVTVKAGIPDWQILDRLISDWNPDALVIGIPARLKSQNHAVPLFIEALSAKIAARYALSIFWVNEDLTTVEARDRLFSQKGYKGLEKEAVDCFAAKLILEDWLNSSDSRQ